MKQFVGFFVLALLCASAVYAGPNAGAKFVATLDKTSGVKAKDAITLTISVTGLSNCNGYTAEALFDSTALTDTGSAAKLAGAISPGKQSDANITPPLAGYNKRVFTGAALLGSSPVNGNSDIATITFTANAGFSATRIAIRQLSLRSPGGSQFGIADIVDTVFPTPSPWFLQINGGGFIEAIPGDLNKDGTVDFEDFFILAGNFGRKGPIPTGSGGTVTQTVTVHDTVFVTRIVRDTIRISIPSTTVKRDTIYLSSNQQNRPPELASWADVVAMVQKSTYWLGYTARGNYEVKFVGTGFCVGKWFIATNAHVAAALFAGCQRAKNVQKLNPYVVAIKAGTSFSSKTTLEVRGTPDSSFASYIHPEYNYDDINSPDVALLWIDQNNPGPSDYLLLAPNSALWELAAGQEIGTLGFPGEIESNFNPSAIQTIATFKQGTISALRPYKDWMRAIPLSDKILQHDFNLTPGTSGSPIFNKRGEVIALNYAGIQSGSLGFGIRADELREVIGFLGTYNKSTIPNMKPAILSILKDPTILPIQK